MSEKHTPGRLAANPIQPNQIATADARREIARATILSSHHETAANARRIVACWNACEGISTEALELGAIQDRIASACGELYEVKRQRDELLQAIKNLVSVFSLDSEESEVVVARATIAKATNS